MNQPTIQAAIDAVGRTGGEVRLEAREYRITEPLTGRTGVTLRGAGRGATTIRQMTRDVPVLRYEADSHDVRIAGMTLSYADWQRLDEPGAVALAFDGPGLFWKFSVENVAIERAQTAIGYTGRGTVATYDMTWDDLYLRAFSHRAIDLESPDGGMGQPGHAFRDLLIEVLNIIPRDSAIIWLQGVSAVIDNIVVANSRNAILYAFGGSKVDIRGLHVEGFVVDTNYARMFGLGDLGFLSIATGDISGVVDIPRPNEDRAFLLFGDAGRVEARNLILNIERRSGGLVHTHGPAQFALSGIYDGAWVA